MTNFSNLNLCKNIVYSFIKVLQKNGTKEFSELTVKNLFSFVKKLSVKYPFILFKDALDKIKFYSEIKSVKISGVNYKIPVEIKPKRQKNLIFKIIILNGLKKNDTSLEVNLFKEILDSCNLVSNSVKLGDDFHKIAELNKIYIQYRY